MENLENLTQMLSEALPLLKEFGEMLPSLKEWQIERKEIADGKSQATKSIEDWQKRCSAAQKSEEEYATELEKRIYRGQPF